jgi:hypothetical protein
MLGCLILALLTQDTRLCSELPYAVVQRSPFQL